MNIRPNSLNRSVLEVVERIKEGPQRLAELGPELLRDAQQLIQPSKFPIDHSALVEKLNQTLIEPSIDIKALGKLRGDLSTALLALGNQQERQGKLEALYTSMEERIETFGTWLRDLSEDLIQIGPVLTAISQLGTLFQGGNTFPATTKNEASISTASPDTGKKSIASILETVLREKKSQGCDLNSLKVFDFLNSISISVDLPQGTHSSFAGMKRLFQDKGSSAFDLTIGDFVTDNKKCSVVLKVHRPENGSFALLTKIFNSIVNNQPMNSQRSPLGELLKSHLSTIPVSNPQTKVYDILNSIEVAACSKQQKTSLTYAKQLFCGANQRQARELTIEDFYCNQAKVYISLGIQTDRTPNEVFRALRDVLKTYYAERWQTQAS